MEQMMEKITCKDLMVGDWIMYKSDSTENAFPIQVTADMFCDELTKWAARFEHITLTAEILEKNGIKKVDYDYLTPNVLFESKDQRIRITDITNRGDGYWNVHIDNEDYETIGSCDVKYVHQFQQLLRLCGYEMDVVV